MKMPKTRVCHARGKRKRKKLREKNFFNRVRENRLKKMVAKTKGETFRRHQDKNGDMVTAKTQAVLVRVAAYYDHGHPMRFNQRQKRKRWRQSPYSRKKAA
jgi:hypothetical protein